MGIFSRRSKPIYGPLIKPNVDEIRLPNLFVMRREGPVVQKIAEISMENATNLNISAWPTLSKLEEILVNGFSGFHSNPEAMAGFATLGARLGYMTGILENKSGVAREGMSEARYSTSLVLATAGFGEDASEYWQHSTYCVNAGYYVARVGEIGLQEVLARIPERAPDDVLAQASETANPHTEAIGHPATTRPKGKKIGIRRPSEPAD